MGVVELGKKNRKHDRRYQPPKGATVTPLSQQQIMLAMQAANSAQGVEKDASNNVIAFTPGSPVAPTPGLVTPDGPRGWTFPLGYNINQYPRATELSTFDELRNLANLYDGYMMCEQVWMDLCSRLEIVIKPYPKVLAAAGGDESVFANDIAQYEEFFNSPDPSEDLDLKSWIRKALREQLELDALPIYVQKDMIGRPCALNIVDGSTIKPLIDTRGRKPHPPFPAYQQFWHGAPLGMYTTDDMLYMVETPRADSIYGLSRVERIINRINQALRKQTKDLALFTEGNLPQGILELPPITTGMWTADKVIEWQQIWDGTLAGNDQMRSRLKVVLPGSKYTPIEAMQLMSDYDLFLLNTTAACMGLTMAELGFTENVNKSSGDSQENVIYRRAMRPLMNRYAELFTLILRKYFNEKRFYVTWSGFEETEDLQTQANAYGALVKVGLIDVATANRAMGLPLPEVEIPRFVLTATGPVFLNQMLDPDVLKAQKEAQLSGLALAKKGGQAAPQDKQEQEDNNEQGNEDESEEDKEEANHARAVSVEYRRWRECALSDVKQGRAMRNFQTTFIPQNEQEMIRAGLAACQSVDDVRAVFNALKSGALVRC